MVTKRTRVRMLFVAAFVLASLVLAPATAGGAVAEQKTYFDARWTSGWGDRVVIISANGEFFTTVIIPPDETDVCTPSWAPLEDCTDVRLERGDDGSVWIYVEGRFLGLLFSQGDHFREILRIKVWQAGDATNLRPAKNPAGLNLFKYSIIEKYV